MSDAHEDPEDERLARARLSLDSLMLGKDDPAGLEGRLLPAVPTVSLGPYRVLEPLGQGGMGVVYRARHAVTERAVAVKTVRLPTPRWIESIRREIDALTRIRHPGIVRIVDHGVHEGRPWYAMDLLEGESLRDFGVRIWSPFRVRILPAGSARQLTATAPLSQDEDLRVENASPAAPSSSRPIGGAPVAAGALPNVLSFMRRLCTTLAFLHGEGFVSCDLKPENVLLVGPTPVLIDFGLSSRFPGATGREAIDTQRSMAGTLPYMSPEQVRGELLDARSDIYAIGCVLYELLTGTPPFTGAPFAIRAQHLTAEPPPPSAFVRDVPAALEALVLRLLAKEPNDRVGFADEVASKLAEVYGDSQRLHDFPPARPYLYRPRFVGRADTLAALAARRDRACAGDGALVLVGGESGVGKTRLALELTRVSPGSMRVIASASVSVSPEQVGTASSSPLHAVRPLLRAVADRCQEGGPEVTERLLGDRRAVLAVYEPLLADVPADEPLGPVVSLAPEASRQRLLRYLAQTFIAFAQERPLLWILDDLGWADDLSLAFLNSLTPEHFASTPALLVGTYRTEEANDAVRSLGAQPHVVHMLLGRLGTGDVAAMVADMLAMPRDEGFADYVATTAEGNPFFVTEHVRTAVSERIFYRDPQHRWTMRGASTQGRGYEALPLPRSLRELIDHRLRALSPVAQAAARVAAVIGRESEADLVIEVADLSPDAAAAAIDELVRRQVLEQPTPDRLRFGHDKLREVAYQGAPEVVRAVHARAAAAIERRLPDDVVAADTWATLGHHFAAGSLPEQAVRYLHLAADYARATFANVDAIVLYRRAIAQVEESFLAKPEGAAAWRPTLLNLYEALGDVLALGGRREEARAAYAEGLRQVDAEDKVPLARLHRKTGKTWEGEHRHDEALRLYRLAAAALASEANSQAPSGGPAASEWLQASIDELWVHYWQGRLAEMQALSARLEGAVARSATALQRSHFLDARMKSSFVQTRFRVAPEAVDLAKGAFEAAEQSGDEQRVVTTRFNLGFARVFFGDFAAGAADLDAARAGAQRIGDIAHQVRALSYLAVAARMQRDAPAAVGYAEKAAEAATRAQMREYVAIAQANQAWAASHAGDDVAAEALASAALATWRALPVAFPFEWLALLPLVRVHLNRGEVAIARARATELQAPRQQALPLGADDALRGALAEAGAPFESAIRDALRILGDKGYH